MTMTWTYTITTTGRVSAGASAGIGNVTLAHAVIPGNTVRGALASAWWRERSSDFASETAAQARLDDLFEHGLIFGQAVPEGATLLGRSVLTCKYPDGGTPARRDMAFASLETDQPTPPCDSDGCGCGGQWGDGWQFGGLIDTHTHVELDAHGRAASGQLFSRQSLHSGTTLHGTLTIPDGVLVDEADQEFFSDAIRIRVGGRRTVHGQALFQCDTHGVGAHPETVSGPDIGPGTAQPGPRHRALRDRHGTLCAVLRLSSPAILVDRFGGPTTDPLGELRRVLRSDVEVKDIHRWTRTVPVTGWHARAHLPRPKEWAIDAGGTFVVSGFPEGASLGPWRIGLRTAEGYGELRLAEELEDTETIEQPAPLPAPPGNPLLETFFVELATRPSNEQSLILRRTIESVARVSRGEKPRGVYLAIRSEPWIRNLPEPLRRRIGELIVSDADRPRTLSGLEAFARKARP